MEIIVVDNNSVDGSVMMLREKFPGVKLIANTVNTGFSKANNQGIRIAEGDLILLLNPDTVVEETTFSRIIRFMDDHPDAGALGVKMIDGSGHFLPESKRGLPTPSVAFYKISGLSALFPKSKTFGRYHLGFLDPEKTHEVEVLAGAFMLVRKTVFDKTGLLDEDFFMYGEDIDLSYRIRKAGFKNYYFPETRIIHYKGESTRKSSVNYVFVFYNAMLIFARKHFSQSHIYTFSLLIRIAIYFRAGAAVLTRIWRKLFLPLLDILLLFSGMYFLKSYWGHNMQVNYPAFFLQVAVPGYIFLWVFSVFFSGGYDHPVKLEKVIRGIFTGTLLILVVYALLPEAYRFSRALILLGAVWASISMIGLRLVLGLLFRNIVPLHGNSKKRLMLVGEPGEVNRVLSLLRLTQSSHNFIGFVRVDNHSEEMKSSETFERFYLGETSRLEAILEVYAIDEVIFCGKDVSSNQIITLMSTPVKKEVEFKIAPPESMYIIGSSSVDNPGELYVIDINSISKAVNKRNKRLIDVVLSLCFLILSPVLVLLQNYPAGYFNNLFRVFSGKFSWVGYAPQPGNTGNLPQCRPGILNPVDGIQKSVADERMVIRLNTLYAKDYRVYTDLRIIARSWRKLGRNKP